MAKQKNVTSKKANSNSGNQLKKDKTVKLNFWQIVRDERTRKVFGLLFLVFAIFLLVSMVSYCRSWQNDQDKVFQITKSVQYLGDKTEVPDNTGGRLGNWLSHLLIYRGFGLGSFAFVLFFAGLGINRLGGYKRFRNWNLFRLTILNLLVIAPILALCFSHAVFPVGGAVGRAIVDWLSPFAGKLGTGMLLAALFLCFLIIQYNISFRVPKKVKDLAAKTGDRLAEMRQGENEAPFPQDADAPAPGYEETPVPANELVADPEAPELPYSIFVEEPVHHFETFERSENHSHQVVQDEAQQYIVDEDGVVFEPPVQEDHFYPAEPVAEEQETEMPVYFEAPEIIPQPELIPVPPPHVDVTRIEARDADDFDLEVTTMVETEEPVMDVEDNRSVAGMDPYDPSLDLRDYRFPTIDLLENRQQESISLDKEELERNKQQIIQTLKNFGLAIQRISATVGPTVTLYEIVPAEGVRISKIRNLEDDIALSLSALGIRIIAPIPGKGTIGIEVPNLKKQTVNMRNLLASEKFANNTMALPIALGKKIDNENYIVDLATMPHLLMAGATGQGKSVGLNAILVSLLYKKHPSQLKFVLVDPKKVELSLYRQIEKHFLAKLPDEEEAIITDTKKVINTLNALCIEMDQRYDLLKEAGTRNIKEYNDKFIARKLNPTKGHKYLPYIVLVVDEFADLIMTAGKEVEMPIARLAQLARAVGIHLIIATQRPSVNVITGTIKANFPARIAFKVSAKVDSRTILDTGGAEQLVGRGDMLISHGSEVIRLQCAFVDTPEVENVCEFIGNQRGYLHAFELPEYVSPEERMEVSGGTDLRDRDTMFAEAARMVVESQSGSTSMLQRKFNLGYNRAGRIMDQLEAAGIVGPTNGAKPREVYFKTVMELEQFLETLG
jgi:S-DNA-T family DNA segregation ATPase FtsK/SpoIIIE